MINGVDLWPQTHTAFPALTHSLKVEPSSLTFKLLKTSRVTLLTFEFFFSVQSLTPLVKLDYTPKLVFLHWALLFENSLYCPRLRGDTFQHAVKWPPNK